MTTDAATLLRALSGASPGSPAGAAARSGAAPGVVSFAGLLEKARAGELSSGAPVTVARGAAVDLSEDQLRRLSIAADRAEAAGATRALVLIDGMALKLDVGVREVTGAVELGAGGALAGIDGVVRAPEAGGGSAAPVGVPAAGPAGLNASLLRALAGRNDSGTPAPAR